MAEGDARDFFISYTAADEPWAEWIGVELEKAGFTAYVQAWDFRPGSDFVQRMHEASSTSGRTIAVLSPSYLVSDFGEAEWRAAFAKDPTGSKGLLVPVRIQNCQPPGLLAARVYIDLVDLDEQTARQRLVTRISEAPRPTAARFPGTGQHHREVNANMRDAARRVPFETNTDQGSGQSGRRQSRGDHDRQHATEQNPWEWRSRQRERLPELLGPQAILVGHGPLRQELQSRLDDDATAALVLLSGASGSGKSAMVRWLKGAAANRVVDVRAMVDSSSLDVQTDGSNMRPFLRHLVPGVKAAGERAVLVYDDADHDLREHAITGFVRDAIAQLDVGFVVICTTTPLSPEVFPIPAISRSLERRRADFEEFDAFLDGVLGAAGVGRDAFSVDVRRCLHDLSEQTADFRAVEYVVEMLLVHHLWTGEVTGPAVLRHLLDSDQVSQLQLPAVHLRPGSRLAFRRRDKSELLAQVLIRGYENAHALASVAKERLSGFDEAFFEREAVSSFWTAVMSLCLTHSPRDLVLGLLTEDQIREEINRLKLDPAQLIDEREEQADLLVRSLGFTLIDAPKGLTDLKAAVQDARTLVEDGDARIDVIKGAAAKVIGHAEKAVAELLHFWAGYVFGSLRELVKAFNAEWPEREKIDVKQLTPEDVVRLLRFVNKASDREDSVFRLSFPQDKHPIPVDLLHECERFNRARGRFEQLSAPGSPRSPAPQSFRVSCEGLVDAATKVLDEADGPSQPSVIKLTEIVFDEFSRRIFRGVDSEGHDIRFALTDDEEHEELTVAAHYFMLPQRPFSVNPHIVPLTGGATSVLFDRATDYQRSSMTQRAQAGRLLELVTFLPDDRVIDVGSGTGELAIEVARSVTSVRGIDKSPDMVRQAQRNAEGAALVNVVFEVADLLEYDPGEWFDVVLSNSAMHWILPEDRAYQQLYRLLRRGGRLAVHQGGKGTYKGLHDLAINLLEDLGYGDHFHGWRYLAYYPSREEFEDLLERVGFVDIDVKSEVTDGSEHPDLVRDFSEAGLLPYLAALPETQRDSFKSEFLEEAKRCPPDLYSHRLYVVATRP